jgi:hypothetical protein
MRQLTEKSTKDAAAVKAITVITILYLPTTVVAVSKTQLVYVCAANEVQSFFSTQFVFQDNNSNGKPTLSLADNWWLYVAISVPLTITTISIWYAWISWPWRIINYWRAQFPKRSDSHEEPGTEKTRSTRQASDVMSTEHQISQRTFHFRPRQSLENTTTTSRKFYNQV